MAVELVLITPLLLLLLLFVTACARLTTAQLRVNAAVHAAARAASITRAPAGATRAARTTAGQTLTGAGPACRSLSVRIDTHRYRPGGTVRVRLTCTVALADLALLHLPGTRPVTGTATSPIDRYRGTAQQPHDTPEATP